MKRKWLYLGLAILFTLVFGATLALHFWPSSSASGSTRPEGFSMPEGFSLSEGFSGTFPQQSGDDADSSQQMTPPDFGDESGFPFGGSGSFTPPSFSQSETQEEASGFAAVLPFVRTWWIPFAAASVALALFFWIAFGVVCKKQRRMAEPEEPEEDDTPKRKRPHRVWIPLVAIALVIALVLTVLTRLKKQSEETSSVEVKETVIELTPDAGTIETEIAAAGTLSDPDANEIKIPEGVTITALTVKNGDTVAAGETIAVVDAASVMQTIRTVQETINALDEALDEAADDTFSETVTAPAAGRVKAIYAEAGTSVLDTMSEHGALVLLSLDGLMQVEFADTGAVETGDTVTVTVSDGMVYTGRVQAVSDGIVTVTLSDEQTVLNDAATVTDEAGATLGSGTLYPHSALKVTAIGGTVASVSARDNARVSKGQTLLKLTDTRDTATYDSLLEKRETLLDQLGLLLSIHEAGGIVAPVSGEISGLDESLPIETVEADAPVITASHMSARTPLTLLSESEPAADGEQSQPAGQSEPFEPSGGTGEQPSGGSGETTQPSGETGESSGGTGESTGGMPSGGSGGFSGGFSGSFSGFSGNFSGESAEQEEQTYEIEETVIGAVTPHETILLSVTVDELDVSAVSIGSTVPVSIDALSGRQFTATVTGIASADSSSGNAKYTVSLELDRTDTMLSGMNAVARFGQKTVDAATVVPLAAIEEHDGRSFVYTTYDEKTDTLGGAVEITTGAADAETAEVLSGLSGGVTVYYRYADSLIYSFMQSAATTQN